MPDILQLTMNQEILDQLPNALEEPNPMYPPRKIHLVNDRSVYLKGLFGMLLCIPPGGIIGLVLVKMSLNQAKEASIEYQNNPDKYKPDSMERVNKGRTMAQIGLAIFILEILIIVMCTSL